MSVVPLDQDQERTDGARLTRTSGALLWRQNTREKMSGEEEVGDVMVKFLLGFVVALVLVLVHITH